MVAPAIGPLKIQRDSVRSAPVVLRRAAKGTTAGRLLSFVLGLVLVTFVFPDHAKAASYCDKYPERLGEVQLKSYSDKVRAPMPAAYARLLAGLKVANTDPASLSQSGLLGPHIPDLDDPVIVVPKGYLRLSCKVSMVSIALVNRVVVDAKLMQDDVLGCVRKTEDDLACMTAAMDHWSAKVEQAYAGSAQFPKWVDFWTERNFGFVLAHEAAHAMFEVAGESMSNVAEVEAAADLQAGLATLVGGSEQYIYAAAANFGVWSVLDPAKDWQAAGYPSFACRMRSAEAIIRRVHPRLAVARSWNAKSGSFQKVSQVADLDPLQLPRFPLTSDCAQSPSRSLDLYTQDFDRLISGLIAVRSWPKSRDFEAFDAIAAIPIEVPAVRGVRAELLADWTVPAAFGYLESNEESTNRSYQDHRDPARNGKAAWGVRLGKMENLLNPKEMNANDFGTLLTQIKLIRVLSRSTGLVAELKESVRTLELYAPGTAYLSGMRGLLAFVEGRCEDMLKHTRKAVEIDPRLEEQYSIFTSLEPHQCRLASRQLRVS